MAVVLTNNAVSRLASSLTSGATALSVTAGEGARFPSVPAGKWFPVTLLKASGALEILRCTARSGDVLTVVRSQEGTAAKAFAVGDRVELRLTSAAIADFKQTSDISAYAQTLLDDVDATAARATLELKAASVTDLASSPTDPTAGRILRVGDGGLINPIGWSAGLNTITAAGFYSIAANSTDWPFVASGGTLIHNVHGAGEYQTQMAFAAAGTEMRIRVQTAGVWSLWDRLTLDKHFSTYFKTLFLSADAAAARATLVAQSSATFAATLATTGAQSIADKLLVKWGSFTPGIDTPVDVTFPTAFPTQLLGIIPIAAGSAVSAGAERNPLTYNYARTGATIRMSNGAVNAIFYVAFGF